MSFTPLAFSLWRNALIVRLQTLCPEAKTIRSHQGQFNDDSIKTILANAPALHVAILGVRPATPIASGGLSVTLRAAIFMVTKNTAAASEDDQALALAQKLFLGLERWQPVRPQGAAGYLSQPITGLAFNVLYSQGQAAHGVMLSSLSFDAVMTLPVDASEAALDDRFTAVFEEGSSLMPQDEP